MKTKLVGTHLRPGVSDYLSLHAYHMKTSKANILRRLIESWYDCHVKKRDSESLRFEIIKTIQHQLDIEKENNPNFSTVDFLQFKEKVGNELTKKNIAYTDISLILNELTLL